jgi:hypothetical protein
MKPEPHAVRFSGPPPTVERQHHINWTPAKRTRFRFAYSEACDAGKDSFQFDGQNFVLGQAKCLLEYLDMVLV